jgi:hypothetical protein
MRRTILKNKAVVEWFGDEIYKQIGTLTEQDQAVASVRVHAAVLRNTPTGSYKRSLRQKYVNTKGNLITMKGWQRRQPGTLKKSIVRLKSRYSGGGYIIYGGNWYAYYARIAEYGTKMRRQKTTGRFTGSMKGIKYMKKAIRDERKRLIQSVKQSMTMLRGMNN